MHRRAKLRYQNTRLSARLLYVRRKMSLCSKAGERKTPANVQELGPQRYLAEYLVPRWKYIEQSSQYKIFSRIWFSYCRGLAERKKGKISLSPQSSFLAHQLGAHPQFEVAKKLLIGMLVIQEEMGI